MGFLLRSMQPGHALIKGPRELLGALGGIVLSFGIAQAIRFHSSSGLSSYTWLGSTTAFFTITAIGVVCIGFGIYLLISCVRD